MTSTTKLTCYMCDKPATSKEHAPPRCIFPERKESLNGEDFRVGLIAVPSCDEHNCEKSRDDEYLMQVMPMSFGSNDVAARHVDTKVKRSLSRNQKAEKALTNGFKRVKIHDTQTGAWFPGVTLNVDVARVQNVIEMNARAIYFHHTGKKLNGPITVMTNFLLNMHSPKLNDTVNELFDHGDLILKTAARHGLNPKVFYYRTTVVENLEVLEFTYYETSRALISIFH